MSLSLIACQMILVILVAIELDNRIGDFDLGHEALLDSAFLRLRYSMKPAGWKVTEAVDLTPCIYTLYVPLMTDDFTQCLVSNSRMGGSRHYPALRPGAARQRSHLDAVVADGGDPAVAEQHGDRPGGTARLRANYIDAQSRPARGERAGRIAQRCQRQRSHLRSDGEGRALMEQLVPIWREAQAENAQGPE